MFNARLPKKVGDELSFRMHLPRCTAKEEFRDTSDISITMIVLETDRISNASTGYSENDDGYVGRI